MTQVRHIFLANLGGGAAMRRLLLVSMFAGFVGCVPTYHWHPHRARYALLKPTTRHAIELFAGDVAAFESCDPIYMGDVICDPDCQSQARSLEIAAWAAQYGATHVRRMGGGSVRTGTKLTTSAVHAAGVSIGNAEVHDEYASWEQYRLYFLARVKQAECLEPALRTSSY